MPQKPSRPRPAQKTVYHSQEEYDIARRRALAKRRARKRRILRNRIIGVLVVLALLVLVVALLAKAFSGKGRGETSGEQSAAPSLGMQASAPASAPEPQSPQAAGYEGSPYYEPDPPLLCNAWVPLPEGYTVQTASVGMRDNGTEQFMETRAATAFLDMQAAAGADGVALMPYSGYRSNERQVANYNASVDGYLAQGLSQEEAERRTQEYYAIPGTSEHEAGLAIDINNTNTSFENSEAFAWLQEHASDYGFILRYPAGRQETTGIAYEPWHYRYVGINHAKAIEQAGIVLEEYAELFALAVPVA